MLSGRCIVVGLHYPFCVLCFFFFVKQKTAYEMRISDWSSDVCSSDLFMLDNWLSNRVFTSYDNIVDNCCEAWNKLVDQPWRIMTIGRRKWAQDRKSVV